MPTDPIQTSEVFSTTHTAGKTVYARFCRMADRYIFDQDDTSWKAKTGFCTTPLHLATEVTDMGDATNSQYFLAVDLAAFMDTAGNSLQPQQFMVQFIEDSAILATTQFWVVSNRRADIPRILFG